MRLLPRLVCWLLGLSALGYVVFCGLVAWKKEEVIYPKHGRERAAGRAAPVGYEAWWRELSGGGRVEAWWRPAEGASAERPAPAVMYFHGNAEIIDDERQVVELWNSLGVSVLLCEHVGYGRSDGVPSLENDIANGVAWHDLLAARPEVRRGGIFAHGFSLGGAFAAQLAARRPVAGLVLESTFSSLPSMARRMGVWLYFAGERMDTAAVLRELPAETPVLLTHGTRDTVIPADEGRTLAEARPGARYVEGDYPHVPWAQNEPGHTLLRAFVAELVARAAAADKGLASAAALSAP